MWYGVQQTMNAPRMNEMVRSALRARFSDLDFCRLPSPDFGDFGFLIDDFFDRRLPDLADRLLISLLFRFNRPPPPPPPPLSLPESGSGLPYGEAMAVVVTMLAAFPSQLVMVATGSI